MSLIHLFKHVTYIYLTYSERDFPTPINLRETGLFQHKKVNNFICVCLTDAKGTIREIVLPKGLDLDRPKRTRTSFTAEQLYRLELEFQRCQYVVGRERTELARQLNLSETQVRNGLKLHRPASALRLYKMLLFNAIHKYVFM